MRPCKKCKPILSWNSSISDRDLFNVRGNSITKDKHLVTSSKKYLYLILLRLDVIRRYHDSAAVSRPRGNSNHQRRPRSLKGEFTKYSFLICGFLQCPNQGSVVFICILSHKPWLIITTFKHENCLQFYTFYALCTHNLHA